MKLKLINQKPKWIFLVTICCCIIISSCQKDLSNNHNIEPREIRKATIQLPTKTNPFSLRNVEKAKATIDVNNKSAQRAATNGLIGDYEQFVYFKFDPQNLTPAQFKALEYDSAVQLMEIPFANMAIYNDEFALDEKKADSLKDGNVYGIAPATDVTIFSTLLSNPLIKTEFLDTIVKIPETDTALQYQTLKEIGYTDEQLFKIKLCFFKRPHGFVRYQDDPLNRLEPVRRMQVWALVFGIPVHTYTDANGYYEIPWRFSIGTIMGTHAKNSRVNVKPLDTHGTVAREIYTLMAQFVVGSIHIAGWVSPCSMKDNYDFNFTGHTQVRYWSQILNAYYFHDQYTANDQIKSAPQGMVCYAQWANTKNFLDYENQPDFGQASTPMLGHMSLDAVLTELLITNLFDGINLSYQFPNAFNILTGLLPDMIFRVPQAAEPKLYNSRFAEIAFHELGHASHFMQVGQLWWANLGRAEIPDRSVSGNPYGDGYYTNAGHAALAESWAEFIGMNYQLRRYQANVAYNTCTRARTYFDGLTGTSKTIYYKYHYPSTQLIENQMFFYGGGDWIPMGLYHDLMDNTNLSPNNPAEDWDGIEGVTIKQMYNAFGPNVTSACDYNSSFTSQNPNLNQALVFDIFDHHRAACY